MDFHSIEVNFHFIMKKIQIYQISETEKFNFSHKAFSNEIKPEIEDGFVFEIPI